MSFMRAAVLANFPEAAAELGLDPETALRSVGLSLEQLATPDLPVPGDDVVRLIEGTAGACGADTFGLRLSHPRSMSGFGVVGLLLAQLPSMRAALQVVFRYQPLINESLALRLEVDGGLALLSQEVLTTVPMQTRQTVDLALAASLTLFRTLLGPQWNPRCVYFRHAAPRSLAPHNRIFRCRCVFGSDFNGISFNADDLDKPNPMADPALARYAEQLVGSLSGPEADSAAVRVRRLVHLFMPLQRAAIRPVAQAMACSVRKLQLDLAAEDTSFGELLDLARRERAHLYLQNAAYSIDQVASLLGYNHPTSFTRWFRGQSGHSPSAWRSRQQVHLAG